MIETTTHSVVTNSDVTRESAVWYNRQGSAVMHFIMPETRRSTCMKTKSEHPGIGDSKRYCSLLNGILTNKTACVPCLFQFKYLLKTGKVKTAEKNMQEYKGVKTYEWVKRGCAQQGCEAIGIAPIPLIGEEKPHYCIDHNESILS